MLVELFIASGYSVCKYVEHTQMRFLEPGGRGEEGGEDEKLYGTSSWKTLV
jgi:hypothetical protein